MFVRGVFRNGASNLANIAAAGFNTVDVAASTAQLDAVAAAGLKGFAWLYGYSNSTCTFYKTDAEITTLVNAIKNHSALIAYQLDDEPNANLCPTAPAQMKARHQLVKSLDPTRPTMLTVSTYNGAKTFPYEDWIGCADIIAPDVYPYTTTYGDRSYNIDTAIQHLTADGWTRYWPILQGFADSYYRIPTDAELQDQFDRWDASQMEGYLIYHWDQQAAFMTNWLNNVSALVDVCETNNARDFAADPDPVPPPTPAPVDDDTAPSAPTGLTVALTGRQARLSWGAASDDIAVTGYNVYRNGNLIARVASTVRTYQDKPPRSQTVLYAVRAVDAAGNLSAAASASVQT